MPERIAQQTEPTEGQWSVWVDNPLADWTFTFEYADASREECLRYLNIATDKHASRLWNFILVRPDRWQQLNRRRD